MRHCLDCVAFIAIIFCFVGLTISPLIWEMFPIHQVLHIIESHMRITWYHWHIGVKKSSVMSCGPSNPFSFATLFIIFSILLMHKPKSVGDNGYAHTLAWLHVAHELWKPYTFQLASILLIQLCYSCPWSTFRSPSTIWHFPLKLNFFHNYSWCNKMIDHEMFWSKSCLHKCSFVLTLSLCT